MKRINLYTDGSCLGNPGPGGWAYVLEFGQHRKVGADSVSDTTNNRMELEAVIRGLDAIKNKSHPVQVFTDSEYVVKGFTQWLKVWKRKGWKNARKRPVKNKDLWQFLDRLTSQFDQIEFTWIRGHNGHEWNEWVDTLAREAAQKAKGIRKPAEQASRLLSPSHKEDRFVSKAV